MVYDVTSAKKRFQKTYMLYVKLISYSFLATKRFFECSVCMKIVFFLCSEWPTKALAYNLRYSLAGLAHLYKVRL